MSDTIHRQDAIKSMANAIWHYPNELYPKLNAYENAKDLAIHGLQHLPSAEPTIIRCRDCKHHDGIRCFRWNSTIITGFDDYCSNAERRGEEE